MPKMMELAFRMLTELARTHTNTKRVQNRIMRATGLKMDGRTISGTLKAKHRKAA